MPAAPRYQHRLRLLGQHLDAASQGVHTSRPSYCSPPARDLQLVAQAPAAGRHRRRTTVNAAEHVWLSPTDVRYPDYPFRTDKPHSDLPQRSMEQLLWQMKMYDVDKVMISHVVSLGMDNSYTAQCIRSQLATRVVLSFCLIPRAPFRRNISTAGWRGSVRKMTVAPMARSHPDKFAATGLLVGDGMLAPDDPTVPARLEELIVEQGFSGLRLSPIYDKHIRWL